MVITVSQDALRLGGCARVISRSLICKYSRALYNINHMRDLVAGLLYLNCSFIHILIASVATSRTLVLVNNDKIL